MQWFNAVKNKLASVWEDRKVKQKEKWSPRIEKDLEQLTILLEEQHKNQISYNKQANELLADNIEFLKLPRFFYVDDESQLIAQTSLLKLWSSLLITLDLVGTGSIYNYYKALIFLTRRNEFGPACLKFNSETKRIEIPPHGLKIARQYRKMLFHTQDWIQSKIASEEVVDPETNVVKKVRKQPTYLFSSFVANLLAINSFHIPAMLDTFVKVIGNGKQVFSFIFEIFIKKNFTCRDNRCPKIVGRVDGRVHSK